MKDLGTFTVDVQMQEDGKLDVYIAHEGSSGSHYRNVDADRIGELMKEEIGSITREYAKNTPEEQELEEREQ